ncbi:hypothetical protein [Nannocystis bainbridge]|uniref:PH domain-containing protein n=1 Tax=Nannocystis bainbridge TaxID=2995303 RepID=A0ABT5EE07_9BACT|nr:hypothetical protein [Nannocystis bainbridge]MDC0723650.1 hypothetical protein [Nannocystis bainbridge]
MTTTHTGFAIATETILETDWRRVGMVVAIGTVVPATVGAPFWQAFMADTGGLLNAFQALARTLFFVMGGLIVVWLMVPGATYIRRTAIRIDLFEHGVELRDAAGAVLGQTADGSLRVTHANLRSTKSMLGGLRLDHRGGALLISPNPTLAPWPGQAAQDGMWHFVSGPMYEGLRRLAA